MIYHLIGMDPHPLLGFGTLLAEGKYPGGSDGFILLLLGSMGLPALLGGLALWLGRPRSWWAPLALGLGVLSVGLAGFVLGFLCTLGDPVLWSVWALPLHAAVDSPLLLGLGICAWAWRCWRQPKEKELASPRT